jgi:hypothetical protein
VRYDPDDPRTWPRFDPLIIAHDVGRSRDRSTAVVGGNCPVGQRRLGIVELEELPEGLYGSARASSLATVDRRYDHNALIVADLSNDATYAEVLVEAFGSIVYKCLPGQHDDLGISCAMLAWAARHPTCRAGCRPFPVRASAGRNNMDGPPSLDELAGATRAGC